MPLWAVAEDHTLLAECLRIGGDWLAVGMDARPESLRGYPWRHRPVPRLDELVTELSAAGVQRFVFSHVAPDDGGTNISRMVGGLDVEITVAGGVTDLAGLHRLRDSGVSAVILGEALFTGAIDLEAAVLGLA